MPLKLDGQDFDKFICIGDKVLVKPRTPDDRTISGLYLPPTVTEKEKIQSGYIYKVGPGYPIPSINEAEEPWSEQYGKPRYVPLQACPGDIAVYLQGSGYEIEFRQEKYLILSHSAILLLIRDEDLLA